MNRQRIIISVIAGVGLGIVCIVGATLRSDTPLGPALLFAFWYNRVLMGAWIGCLPAIDTWPKRLMRGAGVGLIVSFAFYATTGFDDVIGFLVGAPYGIIIESVAVYFKTNLKRPRAEKDGAMS